MRSSDLAQPVGNTSEGSTSMGGSGRLYSPFSPMHNIAQVRRIIAQDVEALRTQTNPLSEDEEAALLAYQQTDTKTMVPTHATLAVGGLIVNREWAAAAQLCRKLSAFASKRSAKEGVTYPIVFNKLAEYLDCLVRGELVPMRTAATKGELKKYKGQKIPLWDDVVNCCLAKEGNVKLPFAAYSEMPVITCPGAGGVANRFSTEDRSQVLLQGAGLGVAHASRGVDITGCASFCYSLKALRNPTVCYRLYTLTLGMSVDPARHTSTVVGEMLTLFKKKGTKILRLFVDGDFRSQACIETWMDAIRPLEAHGIMVYGYSKSWPEFLALNDAKGSAWWPKNYVMNVSSGSRHDDAMKVRMKAHPVARGEFIAVDPLQRLLWKAMTQVRGERVWKAFTSKVNAVSNSSISDGKKEKAIALLRERIGKLVTRINPCLSDAYNTYIRTVDALEKGKVRGTLETVHKKTGKVTLKEVWLPDQTRARLKAALGGGKIVPGPVVQAATYGFLLKVKGPSESPCPISCGACPVTAIPAIELTLQASGLSDTEFLQVKDLHACKPGDRETFLAQRLDEYRQRHNPEEEDTGAVQHMARLKGLATKAGSGEQITARQHLDMLQRLIARQRVQQARGKTIHMCGDARNKNSIIIGVH